jgi:type I restriction enzyme, S subunit
MSTEATVAFGKLCEHSAFGPRFGSEDYASDGNVATLRTTDISSDGRIECRTMPIARLDLTRFSQHVLQRDDLVITRSGRVGTTAVFSEFALPVIPGAFLIRFRLNRTIADPKFYCYFFNSVGGQSLIASVATGSAQQNVNIPSLHGLTVPCPPLDEQRAIAAVLGALDDKIELNRRMNETLEAMARALFKSWFVDFDPVHAKAEGRAPFGMDAATAKLFPSTFEESELGLIPSGWTRAPLSHWALAMSGATPSKADSTLWGGSIPWISPKVMTSIHADESDAFVTKAAVDKGMRIAPTGATLVMVRGMGLHQGVRVSQVRRDVTFNQDVKALVPREVAPSLLLFGMLNGQDELLQRVQSSGHGTGVLPSDILLGHSLTLPAKAAQEQLAISFDALNDRISSSRLESRTLAELRDALLPRLLSGELRVKDAEKLVEAAS